MIQLTPCLGGGLYRQFGTAKNGVDPQNQFTEVMKFDTTDPNAITGAIRILGDHVQVRMLANQIELKYYFTAPKKCGGGSPRIQLGISGDGDGNFKQFSGGPDQNAFGYLSDSDGFQTGCATIPNNMWIHEDMTNSAPKWGLDQWVASGKVPVCALGYLNCTWEEVVTYFQSEWPNHRVLNAVLVDDSGSFVPADRGCAYYDLVNTGARTYTDHQDASGSGTAPNSCPSPARARILPVVRINSAPRILDNIAIWSACRPRRGRTRTSRSDSPSGGGQRPAASFVLSGVCSRKTASAGSALVPGDGVEPSRRE